MNRRTFWLPLIILAGSSLVIAQAPDPAKLPPKPAPVTPDNGPAPTQKGEPKPGDTSTPRPAPAKTGDSTGRPKPTESAKSDTTTEKVLEIPKESIPAGADPEDLRAMRGAQQMLEAEARLRALIKSGKLKDIDQILSFEEISSWPYEDGLKGMPQSVRKLDGKKVMMTGFMLPIDEVENIKEFLLVQSLWSCCYGQPPDINGIVRVVMQGKKRVDYQFDPIKVVGTFKVVATVEDGYCLDIYQLETESVELIQ
jgi:hypothetical protein